MMLSKSVAEISARILFVFGSQHALNALSYSALRSLWSGISCYFSNLCILFTSSPFPVVVFSAHFFAVTVTETQ
jgi:hypothetical protein